MPLQRIIPAFVRGLFGRAFAPFWSLCTGQGYSRAPLKSSAHCTSLLDSQASGRNVGAKEFDPSLTKLSRLAIGSRRFCKSNEQLAVYAGEDCYLIRALHLFLNEPSCPFLFCSCLCSSSCSVLSHLFDAAIESSCRQKNDRILRKLSLIHI